MNREMKRMKNKLDKSNMLAHFIVDTIFKLNDKDLLNFYNSIKIELINRGVLNEH